MFEDFEGLEFGIDTTKSVFGRAVMGAMLAVFAAASMITTFGFFVTYAPGLGETLHPTYGAYIAGALGVLLFDLAGLGWTVLRARNSDTTQQFVIATGAAVVTIILALLVSALQVVLSSAFDVGLYLADGRLSAFGENMQLTGVIVMTLGFVLNFAAIAAYVNTSKDVTRAVQATQLQAYMTSGRFAADQARAELVTRQTLQGIMRQLPALAARAGQSNAGGYTQRHFMGYGALPLPQEEEGDDDQGGLELDALVDQLVEERLRERKAAIPHPPHYTANGANFTHPANGRGL